MIAKLTAVGVVLLLCSLRADQVETPAARALQLTIGTAYVCGMLDATIIQARSDLKQNPSWPEKRKFLAALDANRVYAGCPSIDKLLPPGMQTGAPVGNHKGAL